MIDRLSGSAMLALALVTSLCLYAQMRLRSFWLALALSCLLAPLLYALAEPLFYSPVNFVRIVLPNLGTFLLDTLRIYPILFLKLLMVPLLAALVGGRRRLTSLELT